MVLEGARMFGYEAVPKRSYQYEIDITIENKTGQNRSFGLLNQQSFESNGNTYYYLGNTRTVTVPRAEMVNGTLVPGVVTMFDVLVTEGELHTYRNNPQLKHTVGFKPQGNVSKPEWFVDIPFTDVEENGITLVTLSKQVDGSIVREDWEKSDIFIDNEDNERRRLFIRQDDVVYGTPRIFLQYGEQGKGVSQGTEVLLDVMVSKGAGGKANRQMQFQDDYGTEVDVRISTPKESRTGTDEETNESIRDSQPLFNNTSGRIVTIHDYRQIQARQAGSQDAQIWDGFEEFSKLQGHIWFSFIPNTERSHFSDEYGNNPLVQPQNNISWVLLDSEDEDIIYMNDEDWWLDDESELNNVSNSNVSQIFKYMKVYSVPTLKFNFRQPVYLDFDIEVHMQQYNQNQASKEQNEQIFESVKTFFLGDGDTNKKIEKFNSKYFNSELIDTIFKDVIIDTQFDVKLSTSIYLSKRNIVMDEADNQCLVFRLGQEFKPIIDDEGYLRLESLPNIQTQNIIPGFDLRMPKSLDEFELERGKFVDQNTYIQPIYVTPHFQGDLCDLPDYDVSTLTKVGEYRVFGRSKTVEIVLDVHDGVLPEDYDQNDECQEEPREKGYLYDYIDDGFRINVKYPSPNIQTTKNTFQRLNSVRIIQGSDYFED